MFNEALKPAGFDLLITICRDVSLQFFLRYEVKLLETTNYHKRNMLSSSSLAKLLSFQ